MRFQLPGLVDYTEGEKFILDFGDLPKNKAKNIQKWFQVVPKKDTLDSVYDELVYLVTFAPLKPFSAIIDIHITRPSGGRWKFKIQLKASKPSVDDMIVIRSPLNRT